MRGNCILLLVDWESLFLTVLITDSHFPTGTQKMVFRIYWLLLRPFVLSSTWTFIFATWPFLSCKTLHRVQLTILKSTQQISINCEHGYFVNVFPFFSFISFFFFETPANHFWTFWLLFTARYIFVDDTSFDKTSFALMLYNSVFVTLSIAVHILMLVQFLQKYGVHILSIHFQLDLFALFQQLWHNLINWEPLTLLIVPLLLSTQLFQKVPKVEQDFAI